MYPDALLVASLPKPININRSRYDLDTFMGRVKHFYGVTNPFNLLARNSTLEWSRQTVENYRARSVPADLTVGELWRAKRLYDSAFHPDTGEKTILIGRMSGMLPFGMILCSGMMVFYRSTPAVIFWQWLNQSYNAGVNYANRSGKNPISKKQLFISYVSATTAGVVTSVTLGNLVKTLPSIVGRVVPWVAVSAANCVNIPLMRTQELKEGIQLVDEDGKELAHSKYAARRAIATVAFSRVAMVTPVMVIPPIVVEYIRRRPNLWVGLSAYLFFFHFVWHAKLPETTNAMYVMFRGSTQKSILRYNVTFQTTLCGLIYVFAVPIGCALFPQLSPISVSKLEPEVQQEIAEKTDGKVSVVYYNKGL